MPLENNTKRVTVLMSTYNGLSYLAEQIESVLAQTAVDINLLVRDDGSVDGTKDLLMAYRDEGKLELHLGTRRLGPAWSFLMLVERAVEADYYAFCDQDDIWCVNKISEAIEAIERIPHKSKPVLYGTAVEINDSKMNPLKMWCCVPPKKTGGAVFQNSMIGNTLVFNAETLALLKSAGLRRAIIMHDWWSFLLVKVAGGTILFNESASVKYRIHSANVLGHKRIMASLSAAIIEIFSAKELRAVLAQFFEVAKVLGDGVTREYRDYELCLVGSRSSFLHRLRFLMSGGLVCRTRNRWVLMATTFLLHGGKCIDELISKDV